jgi:hypothetical protein
MGGCSLGNSFFHSIRHEQFFTSDANALASMFGIHFRNVGLQPCAIAIELLALLASLEEFVYVSDFFHDNRCSLVNHVLYLSERRGALYGLPSERTIPAQKTKPLSLRSLTLEEFTHAQLLNKRTGK